MAFGNTLKNLRRQSGLTQKQLSEQSGVAKITVSGLEQGRFEPTWGTVQKLAKALKIEVTAFVEKQPATSNTL